MIQNEREWVFFRAGGFEQVALTCAEDLASLRQLDQKLWAALACPADTLAIDPRMLAYLDVNKDGRIRAPEIINAVEWTLERLADPNIIFKGQALTLSAFSGNEEGQDLAMTAKRLLDIRDKTDTDSLSTIDTENMAELFPADAANGDGIITAAFANDVQLTAIIAEIIQCLGSEQDRSGEPGVSAALIKSFYEQLNELNVWRDGVTQEVLKPFGEQTEQAVASIAMLRDKINDYFTRVAMVAYDARSTEIMQGQEAELLRLSALNLADTQPLQELPLAGLQYGNQLPLTSGINPAWQKSITQLYKLVIEPIFGKQDYLTQEQWQQLLELSQAYFAWQAKKPTTAVGQTLSIERVQELIESSQEQRLLELVEQDLAVAPAADGLVDLDKLLRFNEHLVTLLRNFISFQNFYWRKDKAIFQAGSLFIDGKSCDLVVEVKDIAAHSAVAANSESFLIYCQCVRRGQPVKGRETMNIVAAVTAGVDHELMVGRNGLFYDRDGNDWDATVVKVIENAISVREAFWSPYRRIGALVSAQIQKMAASRDGDFIAAASRNIENGSASNASNFDIARFAGIFAAIGLALGAIGTALAAAFSGLMSLQWWQWPVFLVGLVVVISGPSMLMAWFKLRRRSLGPILDANGWAVNAQARISIPFGASLTQLAVLPKGAKHSFRDPYASRALQKFWLSFVLVVGLAVLGYYLWVRYNW